MRCPSCGEEVANGMAFCGHCGARVATPTPTPSESVEKPADAGDPALPSLDEEPAARDDAKTEETADLPELPGLEGGDSGLEAGSEEVPPAAPAAPATPAPDRPSDKKGSPKRKAILAVIVVAVIAIIAIALGALSNGSLGKKSLWCEGKWYGFAISTSGQDGIVSMKGRAADDGSDLYLELDSDGTAHMHFASSDYQGTWEKYEELGDDDNGNPYIKVSLNSLGDWALSWVQGSDGLTMMSTSSSDLFFYFNRKTIGELGSDFFSGTTGGSSSGSGTSSGSSGSSSGKGSGSSKSGGTVGQQNALDSAKSYLKHVGGFSEKSLREQLDYEGFSSSEIDYAIKYCGADWNQQCAQSAKGYMDMGGFSRKSLREQLEYEGFTSSQIEYGLKSVGY